MKRQESIENYLETIFMLAQKLGMVRAIDIANEMGFTKPSVSIAMKNLREKELIRVSTEGYISLTAEGEVLARGVYERHVVLSTALIAIGVSEETAKADACRIEHDMSDETFEMIKKYIENEKKKQK